MACDTDDTARWETGSVIKVLVLFKLYSTVAIAFIG
jgi:hypothetical protein